MQSLRLILPLLLSVSGCAQVPPDVFACKSLDPVALKNVDGTTKLVGSPTCLRAIGESRCGYCTFTMTDRSFYVGNSQRNYYQGKSWDQLLDRSVILPAKESYAPMKAYVINACRLTNCDRSITNWRFKLESLDQK